MKQFTSISLLAFAYVASAQSIPRFTPPTNYAVPGASMAVLADVNADGKLDIVTANGYAPNTDNPGAGGHGISVLLGNGNGTFQPAKTISVTGNPIWVVVGDFDNDGHADIVALDGAGTSTISLYKGIGDGTFRAPVKTVVSDAPMTVGFGQPANGSLVAADFNGDGKLDLAVAYNSIGAIGGSPAIISTAKVLLNGGAGSFTTSLTTSIGAVDDSTAMLVRDFNGDGIPDLLLYGELHTLEVGNGDGTFQADTTNFYAGASSPTAFGDFNRDGILDMGGLGASGGLRTPLQWFVNMILGTSGTVIDTPLPGFFPVAESNTVITDLDGDGFPDMVGTDSVFINLGNGLFQPSEFSLGLDADTPALLVSAFAPVWYAAGDLDGNGSPDLIATENGSFIQVALNTGGNPPLLAKLGSGSTSVVTGTVVTETVSVGSGAPIGGSIVSLSSSSPSAVVPATVTIPAGAQSASFAVKTSGTIAASLATISATYRGITLKSNLEIVPHFTLSSVSVAPSSLFGMFGGNPAVGTIALSGPAADGTVVSLSSSNSAALTVPATVTVPAGATTVTFPLSALFVSVDTPVTLTSTFQGVAKTASVTVKKEIGDITITKAEFQGNKKLLKVEGTTTGAALRFSVYDKTTGSLLGQVSVIGGKFTGQLFSPALTPVTTVIVQSATGEAATSAVAQK